MNVEKVREDFPISNEFIYLNVANHSPPSRPVQDAIRGFLEDWDRLARHGDMRVEEACRSFARLIGANPCEVAGLPNTSAGLTIVAESLPLERGMNVVTNDLENPANVYPWLAQRRKGIEVRIIKGEAGAIRIKDVERGVDDQTGVLAISHVQWLTGARSDLDAMAEIAHDHGAYLVVDGIQSIGSLLVDVKRDDIDFLACGSYKWLLGPSGAGFIYAREELIEDLEPPFIGYRAVEGHSLEETRLKGTAQRLELGEPSYLSFVGTREAIDLILDVGPIAIGKRVLKLSGLLFEGLQGLGIEIASPSDEGLRSGIVSFTTGDDRGLYESLTRAGFVVSLRSIGIRVSPDFYNTEDEVERFVEHVRKSIH